MPNNELPDPNKSDESETTNEDKSISTDGADDDRGDLVGGWDYIILAEHECRKKIPPRVQMTVREVIDYFVERHREPFTNLACGNAGPWSSEDLEPYKDRPLVEALREIFNGLPPNKRPEYNHRDLVLRFNVVGFKEIGVKYREPGFVPFREQN